MSYVVLAQFSLEIWWVEQHHCGLLAEHLSIVCWMAGTSMWKDGKRVKVDPLLGVADLQVMLQDIMDGRGSRDLTKLCEPLLGITWKQAPRAKLIHDFASTLSRMIGYAKPGMKLSHDKLRIAIEAEHQSSRGAVLFGPANQPVEWQATQASFRLRCLMSKVRECRDVSHKFESTMQKATVKEGRTLEKLVGLCGVQQRLPVQCNLEEQMAILDDQMTLQDGASEGDIDVDDLLDDILTYEEPYCAKHIVTYTTQYYYYYY